MDNKINLEVCLDSPESALLAQSAGADRVELCSGLAEGGITPSQGMIRIVRKILDIPLHVLIRPRGGDFCYSNLEFEIMQADIKATKQAGADGIVLGILSPYGNVDIERTKVLVELARPQSVTFHRAFDFTPDPQQALEDIIQCGAERILTSGQKTTAIAGISLLVKLIEKAGNRIIIMPGGGIRADNIRQLLDAVPVREVHLSAGTVSAGKMQYKPDGITLNSSQQISEFELRRTDFEQIKRIIKQELA